MEILQRSDLKIKLKSVGDASLVSAVTEFHDILGKGVIGVLRFLPMSKSSAAIEGMCNTSILTGIIFSIILILTCLIDQIRKRVYFLIQNMQ